VVHATAEKTLFGKTAGLVSGETGSGGQFQKILAQVGWFCISLIAVGFVIELAVQFGARRKPCSSGNCETLSNALVLIVGGIPVAMPTVLSVTLANSPEGKDLARGRIVPAVQSLRNDSDPDVRYFAGKAFEKAAQLSVVG